jgi:hypothetical protein
MALGLAACGKPLGTVTLSGKEVPKAREEVSVGSVIRVNNADSQTATYSGASLEDYKAHVRQLERAGWKVVTRTETVASLTTVLAQEGASAIAGWTPAGGIVVNVQVIRPARSESSEQAPANP